MNSKWFSVLAFSVVILGCSAPSIMLRVDGVAVEQPTDLSTSPESISLPLPVSDAIDSIMMDLIRSGFIINGSDRRLGIIQTDDKLLDKSEYFEKQTVFSDSQNANNACLGSLLLAGCLVGTYAVIHDNHNHDNHSNRDCHKNDEPEVVYVTDSKPTIVQQKGRLQIRVLAGSNSLESSVEITGYCSTYTNGIKGVEEHAIRLHPLIQKYACVLAHKKCGLAPGQKIKPDTSSQE